MEFIRRKTRRTNRNHDIPIAQECYFCKLEAEPDFKDVLKLRRYISDRGKIVGKVRSGVCSKHQRKLTSEVKKARYLSLLPYTERHAI